MNFRIRNKIAESDTQMGNALLDLVLAFVQTLSESHTIYH
jgi:hypothetical protein